MNQAPESQEVESQGPEMDAFNMGFEQALSVFLDAVQVRKNSLLDTKSRIQKSMKGMKAAFVTEANRKMQEVDSKISELGLVAEMVSRRVRQLVDESTKAATTKESDHE